MSAFTAGQKPSAANLNDAIPVAALAKGTGGGNHSTTSGTFADIAAAYSVAVAAKAGDILIIRFTCQWFHSTGGKRLQVRFAVAGTAISDQPTNGLFVVAPDTNSQFNTFSWSRTVVSGDISGGLVTVKPQFATDAATCQIRNDGTNGKPLMVVENWRQ